MNVHIVYCHPSDESLTYQVKEEYVRGLMDSGNDFTISNLYMDDFNSDLSEVEYLLEANCIDKTDVDDVVEEQKLIDNADILTFIFPIFWMDCPSKLVGWFTRVFTYGYRYHNTDNGSMKVLPRVNFLIMMGSDFDKLKREGKISAITTMFGIDRIGDKADRIVFYFFTSSSHEKMNNIRRDKYLKRAYNIGLKCKR